MRVPKIFLGVKRIRGGAFFDRDGTLNEDTGYTFDISDLKLVPGARELVKECLRQGLRVVIVTNQSGLARGYYSLTEFLAFNNALTKELTQDSETELIPVYYCPHLPDSCSCRKPSPDLITAACRELNLDPKKSLFVGDARTDMLAAKRAGVENRFLLSENPRSSIFRKI